MGSTARPDDRSDAQRPYAAEPRNREPAVAPGYVASLTRPRRPFLPAPFLPDPDAPCRPAGDRAAPGHGSHVGHEAEIQKRLAMHTPWSDRISVGGTSALIMLRSMVRFHLAPPAQAMFPQVKAGFGMTAHDRWAPKRPLRANRSGTCVARFSPQVAAKTQDQQAVVHPTGTGVIS